jgi:hypothetical protein
MAADRTVLVVENGGVEHLSGALTALQLVEDVCGRTKRRTIRPDLI